MKSLYSNAVRFAYGLCHNKELAEDVVQEAFIKHLEGKARFEGRASFKSWFFSVVRLTLFQNLRTTRIRGKLLDKWVTEDVCVWPMEQHKLVSFDLSSLTERQREVIEMFLDGYTNHEIAKTLSIAHISVCTHYKRAKEKIRNSLQNC